MIDVGPVQIKEQKYSSSGDTRLILVPSNSGGLIPAYCNCWRWRWRGEVDETFAADWKRNVLVASFCIDWEVEFCANCSTGAIQCVVRLDWEIVYLVAAWNEVQSGKRAKNMHGTAQNRLRVRKIDKTSCSNYLAVTSPFSYFFDKNCNVFN